MKAITTTYFKEKQKDGILKDKRYDAKINTIAGEIFDEILTYLEVSLNLFLMKEKHCLGTKVGDNEIATIPFSHAVDLLYTDIQEGKLPKAKKIVRSKNICAKILRSIHYDCLEYFKDDKNIFKSVDDHGPINRYYENLLIT